MIINSSKPSPMTEKNSNSAQFTAQETVPPKTRLKFHRVQGLWSNHLYRARVLSKNSALILLLCLVAVASQIVHCARSTRAYVEQ